MKKLMLLIVMLLICTSAVSAASRISIGRAGSVDNNVNVEITNNNDYDIDNARVRLFIPELDIISPSMQVDLDDNERTIKNMIFLDDVPEGEYLVRVRVKKGKDRKVAYRYVIFN